MDDTSNPTPEQTAAAQESANALVASSVNEMVVLIDGTDMLTLKLALETEQAKGAKARKGAVAALQSAIDGHPELSASAAAAAEAPGASVAPAAPAVPTRDTKHDAGLAPQDARVPGDAAPLTAAAPAVVDAPKEPLGSLPDTAETTETIIAGNTFAPGSYFGGAINTTRDEAPTLGDAIIPTKPGGADLEDVLDDATKDVVSRAPARTHDGLINQLDMKWSELKHFVSTVTGDADGELGEVLAFVRAKL